MNDLPPEALNSLGNELQDFLQGHKEVHVRAVLRTGECVGDRRM